MGRYLDESCFIIMLLIIKDKGKYICIIMNVIGFVLKDIILGNVRLGVFLYYKVCFSMVIFKFIVLYIEKNKMYKFVRKG